jgi:acyl-CoA synthetase (NDP forming)
VDRLAKVAINPPRPFLKGMLMLKPFFEPKSVAVIGASTSPGKLGYTVVENLVQGGYSKVGKVYPINPKADEILGQKAYASVLEVPEGNRAGCDCDPL